VTSCSLMPSFSNRLFSRKFGADGGADVSGGGSGGPAHAVNVTAMMAILRAEIIVLAPMARALGHGQPAKCPKRSFRTAASRTT
jgi:hypothetical protein